MTFADASVMSVYVCPECQDAAQEDNVVERRKAEGEPGAIVFFTVCRQHNPKTGHRRGINTTPALVCEKEAELSPDRCHICDHRCNFELIQCDNCDAWCHYACAKMTRELAERIEKWYCRRCLRKDPDLQLTYAQDSDDCKPSQLDQGFRPSKRRSELVDTDGHAEKRARLDAKSSSTANGKELRSADEELFLDLEEEEPLFLDLEGDD